MPKFLKLKRQKFNKELLEAQFKRAWQRVPHEERQTMLNTAQAKGFDTCALVAIFGCSAALSLAMPWILACIATVIPVLYQVITNRVWRELKPKITATYYTASHTANLYAKELKLEQANLRQIFRGKLSELPSLYSEIEGDESLDDKDLSSKLIEDWDAEDRGFRPPSATDDSGVNYRDVWVCLFPDTMLLFSENPDGAKLELSRSLTAGLSASLEEEGYKGDKSAEMHPQGSATDDEDTDEDDNELQSDAEGRDSKPKAALETRLLISAEDIELIPENPQTGRARRRIRRFQVTSESVSQLVACEERIRSFVAARL
jgi:hypothetical protein